MQHLNSEPSSLPPLSALSARLLTSVSAHVAALFRVSFDRVFIHLTWPPFCFVLCILQLLSRRSVSCILLAQLGATCASVSHQKYLPSYLPLGVSLPFSTTLRQHSSLPQFHHSSNVYVYLRARRFRQHQVSHSLLPLETSSRLENRGKDPLSRLR